MTKEKIEQEARAYSALIAGRPRHIQDFYEREKYKAGFISGANWRIDSVWHDKTEIPETQKWVFVLMDNGFIHYTYSTPGVAKVIMSGCKWAYVDDLLPNKEDEI